MAAASIVRYGELCRLCASKANMGVGINIFENEGTFRQINKKIETCLPIQVQETDELPKLICEQCMCKLESFVEFRERSLHAEHFLLTILKDITSKLAAGHEIMKDITSIDQACILIQPPYSLLTDTIQNISDIDLSHLQGDMEVHQEHMLNQQTVDISNQSLSNIHLSNSELNSSDLSNQRIMVNGVNGIHYSVDAMQLIQQQHLLTEQFRIHQDLNLNIINEDSVCSTARSVSPKNHIDAENRITEVIIKEDQVKLEPPPKKEYFMDNQCQTETLRSQSVGHFEDCNSNDDNSQMIISSQKSFVRDDPLDSMSCENSNASLYVNQNHNANGDWIACNICGINFADKSELEFHYKQHFNYKCATCLAIFANNETLSLHVKEVHDIKLEDQLNAHKIMKTRSGGNAALMLKVRDDSNSESDGGGNMDTTVDDEEDEDDPETDAGDSSTVKRKKWSPKECKDCGKMYKTNYKLIEHTRKHTGEKPYKCKSCDKAFRSKIGLAQHEAKHTGQYDLSCPTCGKGFQCKSYLMVHQRVHSDIKPYPCVTCGRNFKTKQSLLDHTNRHLGVKPYICDVCGRGFITKGLCKAHQKVHTGLDNRKYSCKICNKMFVSKSYLQTHLRIHTGEKPFICEVCGKGFLTRVDLRIHSTMHTGEKSFVCEICGKAFARRDALRCHRRSHTGERPYSCDQCGQTFTQFSPMAIHKRLHTGERPYSCDVCGKSFVSRSTMMSHWKKHVR